MRLFSKQIWVLLLVLCTTLVLAQENSNDFNSQPKFTVRGSVVESKTNNPIPNVNIEVNGGSYTTTDFYGNFVIDVRKYDELTIRHKDFETVYYTIQSNERIKVEVETNDDDVQYSKKKHSRSDSELFKSLIDSAETHLKKDAKKSVQFIEKALGASNSSKENGFLI